uniref:Uncharacterized protein n=1 Tax=Rhodosorus marinus TaxID=101924 RepID=A0A7S3EGV3_9RHOD|mmetsp:Transcript_34968/g.138474  ORF Transcript_34968/g.138474 Transcript_34968/m.138474 type:complete len:305 (+) Transcript_34968:565-1479(+)|eukprot:CAMPEP_0113965848 /NCGR_PEP_ID=MMETSP0011_2-20120614/7985_1 /TAXON_ID=101924 /ORGANISM="Rhodosorus marinus" /LENGTH=304 /DNA_ID=CAMNT_0000978431 /DNA_START=272 /DNA_END=1186 /DNA_ORIENTATION=+ /assembly_acc=CAM_ASM_000156
MAEPEGSEDRPFVIELGSWCVRSGRASEAIPDEEVGVELWKEGGWDGGGLVSRIDGVKDLLLVESSSFLDGRERVDLVGAVMEACPELGSIFLLRGSAASSFAMGRVSAVVVDVGELAAVASPVTDGYVHKQAVSKVDGGGKALSERIRAAISPSEFNMDEAKRFLFSENFKPSEDEKYELPDGTTIQVPTEAVEDAAAWVSEPLPGTIISSINKIHGDFEKTISNADVLLCGGTSLVRGVPNAIFEQSQERGVHFLAAKGHDRTLQNWRGGSILGSLGSYSTLAITRADYAEKGASLVLSKCA